MLIRFDSKVGTFVTFGDIGVKLLQMTGHSGDVPGAILGVDVAGALARLEAALKDVPPAAEPPEDDDGPVRPEREISLRQRAWPLLDLMTRAAKKRCDVMWAEEPPDSLRV